MFSMLIRVSPSPEVPVDRSTRTPFGASRRVFVSKNVGPAVTGLWRPRIVVPGWALEITPSQRELMLLHEEEHVQAGDPRLLAWGLLAVVLAPWNPALWWQLRRLRLAVEVDCDARVLRRAARAPEYGELLLHVGRRRGQLALGTAALGEPVSFLERRIRRMATVLPRWRWLGALGGFAVATGAVVVACEAPRPVDERPNVSAVAEPAHEQAADRSGATIKDVQVKVDPTQGQQLWIRANLEEQSSGQVAALVRQQFPALLRGRDEPVYMWLVFDGQGQVVRKGTAPRALGARGISTSQGPQLIPGYDSLLNYSAREYGVLGYGVLAPNSPPVLWVRLGDNERARSDRLPTQLSAAGADTETTRASLMPTADQLRRLAHQYHPEAFVSPQSGTAIALVFDAQDSVIAHAVGVRSAADRACTDVVARLLPEFRYRRFRSAGCADAAGPRGHVVVYWESLRRR